METPESSLIFVTKFLTLKDVIALSSTCHSLHRYDELWEYFYYNFYTQLPTEERKYLQKLKYLFFSSNRNAITAYNIQKLWRPLSIPDQLECFGTRKTILLYLVAAMVKHGKSIIKAYNKYMSGMNGTSKNKVRWMCSSWEILKGSRRRVFRRNYLSVY